MRRPSPTGLAFCGCYAAAIAGCQWLANNAQMDAHLRSGLRTLPTAPIVLALEILGVTPLLAWLPAMVANVLVLLPMFWASYWLGRFLERWIGEKHAARRAASAPRQVDRP